MGDLLITMVRTNQEIVVYTKAGKPPTIKYEGEAGIQGALGGEPCDWLGIPGITTAGTSLIGTINPMSDIYRLLTNIKIIHEQV
jgi:hypothetical protein